jgi:hypothetical protein
MDLDLKEMLLNGEKVIYKVKFNETIKYEYSYSDGKYKLSLYSYTKDGKETEYLSIEEKEYDKFENKVSELNKYYFMGILAYNISSGYGRIL